MTGGSSPEIARRRTIGRWVRIAAGYVIAVACLVWIFHDVKWDRVARDLVGIRWAWIFPAIAFDVSAYATQAVRWRLLLRPLGTLSPLKATQAVYAGLFTSEVLPMRAGEVVRAYLASRWIGTRFSSVIPSLAVERFFDGVWLSIYIGLAAIFVPLPRNILRAADIFGAVLILLTILLAIMILWGPGREGREMEPSPRRHRVTEWLTGFVSAVRGIGRSRDFYLSFAVTSMILVFQGIAFWLVMVAYGFSMPVWIGIVILLIVYFGTAIPNTPGNVGSYQFFVVIGLALFGVDKTRASGFSMVVFVILTLPVWALGFLALAKSGLSMAQIRRGLSEP